MHKTQVLLTYFPDAFASYCAYQIFPRLSHALSHGFIYYFSSLEAFAGLLKKTPTGKMSRAGFRLVVSWLCVTLWQQPDCRFRHSPVVGTRGIS
jgi:hypothetical protein